MTQDGETAADVDPYKDNDDLCGINVGATTSPLADLASDFVATWSVRLCKVNKKTGEILFIEKRQSEKTRCFFVFFMVK